MESVWLNLFIDAWRVFHVTVFPDCVRPTIIVEWREFFVSYNWIILVMVWALGWRLLLINSLSMTDFSWKREFQFLELELELTHDTLATQGMATKIEFKQNKNKIFDYFLLVSWYFEMQPHSIDFSDNCLCLLHFCPFSYCFWGSFTDCFVLYWSSHPLQHRLIESKD